MAARQRISSAIQLPMPAKPDCISSTAFDRRAGVAFQELGEVAGVEFLRADRRRRAGPPIRRGFAMVKFHPSEETRIAKDERLFSLLKDEVIVLARDENLWVPCAVCHSFRDEDRASCRRKIRRASACRARSNGAVGCPLAAAGYRANPSRGRCVSARAAARRDLGADAGVPLFAKKFDLRELRHARR